MRQVLLRGSWESVLSWHTWSPGCGVHPLGGVLRRGPPWPGLALAPGGEPVGAGALLRPVPVGVVLGGSLVFPCFSVYPTLWGVGAGEQGAVED